MYNYSTNRNVGNTLLAFVGGMVVWALFGNKIKEKFNQTTAFSEMKDQIMQKVDSFATMTEERYNQIVDDVSRTYSKAKGISENELHDLISDLRLHWYRIKNKWNEPKGTGISADAKREGDGDGFTYSS